MKIAIDNDRWIDAPDGVNWQLRGRGGRRGEPHAQLDDAVRDAGQIDLPALAPRPTPLQVFVGKMHLAALPAMRIEALGFGPDHFLTPRPDGKWAGRRRLDGPIPRLLHVGSMEEAALFCFWDHVARIGFACDLACLPEVLERTASSFFSRVRFGKAVYGPSGQVSAVFSKGDE